MNCIYKGKKYLFSISIANKIIRQIKMNVSPSSESQKNSYFKNFCEAFIKNFPKAECIWCEKDELEGFGSSDDKIFFVEGEV